MKSDKIEKILFIVSIIFILTTFTVHINKTMEKSMAESDKIVEVTYKPGKDATGEKVTISQNIQKEQTQDSNDYTNNKIILYANGKNGINFTHQSTKKEINGKEYNYEMIITGWKITSVTKNGEVIEDYKEPIDSNYANPEDPNKDINSIYAEGGWYIVPSGVTSVTVEAVWGQAIYIRSPYDKMYYDEYRVWYYGENNDGTSTLNNNAVEKSSDKNYGTSKEDAISTLKRAYELVEEDETKSTYDTVFLLCGDLYDVNIYSAKVSSTTGTNGTYQKYFSYNYGYNNSTKKPVTIKSPFEKKYSLYMAIDNTYSIYSSVRFDNLYIQHLPTSKIIDKYDDNIKPDTYVIRRRIQLRGNVSFEFLETNNVDTKGSYLWYSSGSNVKLQSGVWSAVASAWINNGNYTSSLNNKTSLTIGGTAKVTRGITAGIGNDMSDGQKKVQINAAKINITGGVLTNVYSSSMGIDCDIKGDTYVYISGGNITNLYGASYGNVSAYQEYKGNVNIYIYGGTLGNIYGAGQRYTSNVDGNVNLSIKNTKVTGNIYGGGKGGTVSGNVFINIDNLTSNGNIYGAGYGLTDEINNTINRSDTIAQNTFEQAIKNYNNMVSKKNETLWNEAPTGFPIYNSVEDYITTSKVHSATMLENSYHLNEVEYRASLTLSAVKGNISIKISNSNIKNSVFGGGEISVLNGDADLNISDSTISGNIYGGGNGNTSPGKVKLYKPLNNDSYEEITQSGKKDPLKLIGEFTWTNDDDILKYFSGIYDGKNKVIYNGTSETTTFNELLEEHKDNEEEYNIINNIIKTYSDKQLIYSSNADKLGAVEGNVTLNLNNVSMSDTSYVCGGGNKGNVSGKTNVTLENMKNISKIYAGGYSGIVSKDTNITINSGIYKDVYGGGYSGQVLGSSNVKIKQGTYGNIFGGGDLSYINGNTDVTIGEENSKDSLEITGLVYGGGRGYDENGDGDASNFITVKGNSKVLIQGINTKVKNYGSTKLGSVAGNIDVNFKNYWSGNSTSKYKTMNGIDRATTVRFNNSYVLLENKGTDGKLEGIKSIDNLEIPNGSGLKISANGEINGNFIGGGELYLDSLVSLKINGNITGQTTLILNPKLLENGTKIIRGGIDFPYLKVAGTSPEKIAVISGETNKYIIREADKETINNLKGENYTYFYISSDVNVDNSIDITSNSDYDRKYISDINNDNTLYILNTDVFSTNITSKYYLTNDDYETYDYTNINRYFTIMSNSNNSETTLPIGTEITLVSENKYYFYKVEQTDISKINLGDFKDELGNKYTQIANFDTSDKVNKTTNETNGTTSYSLNESLKFIISFENTQGMKNDSYYPSLEIFYGNNSFSKVKTDNAKNVINIQNRNYELILRNEQVNYDTNGILNFNGTISLTSLNSTTFLSQKKLLVRMKIKNSNNEYVNIPDGTILTYDQNEYLATNGTIAFPIINNLTTNSINKDINFKINMKNTLPNDQLSTGKYTISLEYLTGNNYKELCNLYIKLVGNESKLGLNVEMYSLNVNKNRKIVEFKEEEERNLTITLKNQSTLKNLKVKTESLEKIEKFTYSNTENSSNNIEIQNGNIENITDNEYNATIKIKFKKSLKKGTYRIVINLYDESDNYKTSDYVNFIVI